jgi:ribosomal protein S18 acetylase RimI-like enzyme
MAFAEDWAREHACAAITLDMSSANDAAGRFYERLGYRVYGLLMRKPIDGHGESPGR